MTFDEWRERVRTLRARLAKRGELVGYWKARAHDAEDQLAGWIKLPGKHRWAPTVERWRSLVHAYLNHFGGAFYLLHADYMLDVMLGIMSGESTSRRCPAGGDPRAICGVEWIGEPPPGYDPDDDSTKASGLFQIPPPYWPERSRAAGFAGASIFDADANVATACYMLFASWPEGKAAPHWHHWSAAHVGRQGSYEKAVAAVADDYREEP